MPKLAVIVLNWNNADRTLATARSVLDWKTIATTLFLVDNASSDGSADRIGREGPPGARLLCSGTNLGFAGGNNLGIREALRGDAEFVLLLNNDAEIDEHGVRRMIATLNERPDIGMVGPLVREDREGGAEVTAGGRDIALHPRTRIVLRDIPTAEILPAAYVPGTVLLTRAALFATVGLLDESYFFSGEIADFCDRARRQGAGCAIDLRATAVHLRHEPGTTSEILHAYYSLRNRFLFVRRNRPERCGALTLYWIACGGLMLAAAVMRGNLRKARAVGLALSDALHGRFGNRNELFLP